MLFKKETYPEQVAEYIREMIRNGKFLPGELVKETVLAELLGISRAPIREALQELSYEGLVTSIPQKGKFVRKMSAKEILDSYTVAGILESVGVVDSLADWTDEDMRQLHKITEAMHCRSDQVNSVEALMELDDKFHDMLLFRCNNYKLVEMARLSCVTLSKVLLYHQWRDIYTPHEFFERHATIADVMYRKDAATLLKMIRNHYEEVGNRLSQYGYADCAPKTYA